MFEPFKTKKTPKSRVIDKKSSSGVHVSNNADQILKDHQYLSIQIRRASK